MSGEMDSETSKEIIEELSTSIGKIDVSVDDELRRLFVEDYLPLTGDPSEDMSSEDVSMSFTAHLNMKKRINELLEDTYN